MSSWWYFEKFLVNHEGQPVRRYDESLDPSELVPDIDVIGQVRARPCILNPNPPILTP